MRAVQGIPDHRAGQADREPPEPATRIVAEIDALFSAGLDQSVERITTSSPIFCTDAAADLSLHGLLLLFTGELLLFDV